MRRKLWRKLLHCNVFLIIIVWLVLCILFTTILYDRTESTNKQGEIFDILIEQETAAKNSFADEKIESSRTVVSDERCAFVESFDNYPICFNKIEWMERKWQSHKCYAEKGVNGSLCTIIQYLSEIENHCPLTFGRIRRIDKLPKILAKEQSDLSILFASMYDNLINYVFIKKRINAMWEEWKNAYRENYLITSNFNQNTPKLNILIYMGFLTKESGIKFGEKSEAGGPLGELVQWSDLIAALFLLGHNLHISTEWLTFLNHTGFFTQSTMPCPSDNAKPWDLIFTDIIGVRYIRRKMKPFFIQNKCKFRILDSFGTHAEFNSISYFSSHKKDLGGSNKNSWGGNELRLQQFLTMYPHTDDNVFLGFIVKKSAESVVNNKKNVTLLYGKETYMWKGMESVIEEVSRHTKLYATLAKSNESMYSMENHGVLSGDEFRRLLEEVKVFLGLGFPLEGPAPLEAIASGAVFINPRFDPPRSRKSYKFFWDKPTLRKITSQNSYTDHFIGKPHVLTIDIHNISQVRDALSEALTSKVQPFVPFEFTATGFLQRLAKLLLRQNFCSKNSNFPPIGALQVVGEAGQSCQDACRFKGLVCEPSYFHSINNPFFFKGCENLSNVSNPYAPYGCSLQKEELLFSCASEPPSSFNRLCPCRNFIKHQIALCKEWL